MVKFNYESPTQEIERGITEIVSRHLKIESILLLLFSCITGSVNVRRRLKIMKFSI